MVYRPHVDGLRAVAILFVLIFHAGLSLFPSGFIGVDIFFVISGYLITGIIYHSLQNQQFSFIEFYNRRLWRLQPVFICLFIVTSLLAFVYFLPDDFSSFGESARSAALFKSNKFFLKATLNYFSENVTLFPLLHTWSLSVEWKCYLLLPLAIYLLYRIFGQKHLAKVVYILTLSFCALSLYYSKTAPLLTYYLFFSRFFEFLIGSAVALTPIPLVFNRYFSNVISLAALVCLFSIARLSGINEGFPNWYTLLLCLATALLIATGAQEEKPFCIKLLSLKPIVFIGLLSYSLYIWHWPVFVLIRYLDVEQTSLINSAAFCFIALIAYLSWRYIEKPSRKLNKTNFAYSFCFLFLMPALVFSLSAYGLKKYSGFPQRYDKEQQQILTSLKKYSDTPRLQCLYSVYNAFHFAESKAADPKCLLGSVKKESRQGLMIGDSFSNHHWQFMDVLGKNADLSIHAYATGNCLGLPGIAQFDWLPGVKGVYQFCRDQNRLHYKMIKENHYDFVILGQAWSAYQQTNFIKKLGDERSLELSLVRISEALDKALQIIVSSGARPVIIKTTAVPESNLNTCVLKSLKRRLSYKPEDCDFNLNPKLEAWFDELFAKMQKKYTQLILIDPKEVQCPNGLCKADINGVPMYSDRTHISDYASHRLAKSYLKTFGNPLLG